MGSILSCCVEEQEDVTIEVQWVKLSKGTHKENPNPNYVIIPVDGPDSGYFELENTSSGIIAIKLAHSLRSAGLWRAKPAKNMFIVRPEQTVCGYFDPKDEYLELYILHGEIFNLHEQAAVITAFVGDSIQAKDYDVPTFSNEAAFKIVSKDRNVIAVFQDEAGFQLLNKGFLRDIFAMKHQSRSGIDVDTNTKEIARIL